MTNEKAAQLQAANSNETIRTDHSGKSHLSKALLHGKTDYDLEKDCLAEMASNGLPFDGKLKIDEHLHRYSCDRKKTEPDEWYVAFSGTSERGTPYLSVAYGTWSGGGKKYYFNSWKKERAIPKEEREAINRRWEEQQKQAESETAKEAEARRIKARSEWDAASETPNKAHTYLACKKVGAHGIRFGSRMFNDGTEKHTKFISSETILVPLRNIDGDLRAVQHIRHDGEKRITGSKRGSLHLIGDITPDSVILVSEGYCTGVSAYEAIGEPTVIAVDSGNILPVVAELKKKFPKNLVVILGDDDVETVDRKTGELCNPGRAKAEAAAKIHRCQVAFPKFPEDFHLPNGKRPTDWNDLHVHFGIEEVKRQLSEVIETSPKAIQIFSREELEKALADNECGDAALFKKLCGKDYLYFPGDKYFYVWNGTSWKVDEEKTRYKKLEGLADHYADEADRISSMDEEQQKPHKKLIKDLRDRTKYLKTNRRMCSVLELATVGAYSTDGLAFNGKWDDCNGYLPCANGLVNLKTGELIESKRSHFIRKHSPFKYDTSAQCDQFEKFVLEIMEEKRHLAEFLKRLIGYISIGHPREHIYVFLYGAIGRNGKGTLIRLIAKALGHLARQFPAELILLQRNPPSSGTPRPDLVHLQGTRFALFSEINKGRVVDSATLKNLSGGDNIAARSLFSNDQKDFAPTHTLLFQANHKPKAPADDPALWSRSILIPFNVTFVENPKLSHERKIDKGLEERLERELPGILRWIVDGAIEYQKQGLLVPEEVRAAVDKYRGENDGIGSFLKERCDLYPELSTKCSALRDAIQKYCESEGFNRPTKSDITEYLQSRFTKYPRGDADYWIGVSLKNENQS